MRSLFLAAAISCLSYSAAATDEPEPPPAILGGKVIFQQVCASCHGKDARGAGPVAQSLKTPPADLTRIAARRGGYFSTATVTAFVDGRENVGAHGTREMPVWGESLAQAVSDKDVRDARVASAIQMVVKYLETIQK